MSESQKEKPYDLEERTYRFAKRAFKYFKSLPRTVTNVEVAKQGIRASGSIGANFIEANEAFSRKDFAMRVKICRKESKESIYWLHLSEPQEIQEQERKELISEATELMKIFGSIIEKSKK
ncbi:MAG: four helix bundle protein [Candidatus Brennerbacteria bacterium]|nr:four helix bundle protein [Candidatus Brennerbacteria bacterium]